MLTAVSSASLPVAASSLRRRRTRIGEGKNSGPTQPNAVTTDHATAIPANTAAAMPMNEAVEIGAPKARRRRDPGRELGFPLPPFTSGGGGIHESAVDQGSQIHVLGQEPGLGRRSLHLRHD